MIDIYDAVVFRLPIEGVGRVARSLQSLRSNSDMINAIQLATMRAIQ